MVLKLSLRAKFWIFLTTTLLAGMYIFEKTQWDWVKTIVEYKLDFAPLISVINIITVILIYLTFKIFVSRRT